MTSASRSFDVVVVGAGMVGGAIAYGLAKRGVRVLAIDGADGDPRAAKANFGLVWVQGKGFKAPAYQSLSRLSARLWPGFAEQLRVDSGIDCEYEHRGGLKYCLSERDFEERAARMAAWQAQLPDEPPCVEMIDRQALAQWMPAEVLGPQVCGASYGRLDGHVNPLKLLRALQSALLACGGELRGGSPVTSIAPRADGSFDVHASGPDGATCDRAAQVVIAAGLGSKRLGAMVGLDVPLRPQRGQVLVTERLAPLLPLPASGVRQTVEGTVMIGVTQEEVGFDLSTTTAAAAHMTREALRVVPGLARANLVRHWACLRVMTPDGFPVYAGSTECPGAWIALCHSGVTLASFHAGPFAAALAQARAPADFDFFHHRRFHVPQAA